MECNESQPEFLIPDSRELVDKSEKSNSLGRNSEGSIGVLDVYIHEARDIHNICIYQNQDVYAKLCLTSNPERTVSTRIINGGGRNPVFDENVLLDVEKIDSSLKIEIWMLSRVRNYLEDQLLGFTFIPLCDVLIKNAKPAQEFSLSSSDLYHSPAGFVQLTLTYTGASPEVLEIPAPHTVLHEDNKDLGIDDAIPCEIFDKIEFPDPEIMNENEQMASEYFVIPCSDLDCKSTEHPCPEERDDLTTCDAVVSPGVDFSCQGTTNAPNAETPPTTWEVTKSDSVNVPIHFSTVSPASSVPGFKNKDDVSGLEDRKASEVNGVPPEAPTTPLTQPLINVNVEQETKVVQEQIVEMYMKSMQQFTEALAKMKLPVDIAEASGKANADGRNSSLGEQSQASKGSEPSPRVFYGSRAFF